MKDIVVIIGSICVAVGVIFILGYLKYKKVDISGWCNKGKSAIENIESITEIIKNNTTGKIQKASDTGALIEQEALKLVNGVSQKVLSGDLDTSKGKKKTAVEGLDEYLKSQGIGVSPQLDNYIDLIVSHAVRKSESDDEINKKIDARVKEFNEKTEKLQSELNTKINEVTILKSQVLALQNKLTTAQNIFSPTQNIQK
mgnify:FL=1